MQVYAKDLMFHFPNQLCILFCLKTEVTFDFRFQFVMNFKLKHTNKKIHPIQMTGMILSISCPDYVLNISRTYVKICLQARNFGCYYQHYREP